MNTNAHTETSDSYLQYKWIASVLNDVQELSKEGNEDEGAVSISLTNKRNNKSDITLTTDERDVTVSWDGSKLSASAFNNDSGEAESIEVPDAISTIIGVMEDEFDIVTNLNTNNNTAQQDDTPPIADGTMIDDDDPPLTPEEEDALLEDVPDDDEERPSEEE